MEVEIRRYRVRDVLTKQERDGNQYQILVDGRHAGYIAYWDGAAPLMIERFNPLDLEEIETKVREALAPQVVGKIRQPRKPPPQRKPQVPLENFT